MKHLFFMLVLATGLLMSPASLAQSVREVFVNGVRLSNETVQALESSYGTQLPDGAYWYDRVSGFWDIEGGPPTGQIHPWLELVWAEFGSSLKPDASHGNTGVFVNGREIHELELQLLQGWFGYVLPGRYWLDSQGIGGYEGGPPMFDLRAQGGGGSGGQRSNLGHSDTGSVIGGDGITGFIGPDGTGVTCGADGGCLFSP